jgi:hypothetical protein
MQHTRVRKKRKQKRLILKKKRAKIAVQLQQLLVNFFVVPVSQFFFRHFFQLFENDKHCSFALACCVSRLGVWGLGFGVWVWGFGVWGLGFGKHCYARA